MRRTIEPMVLLLLLTVSATAQVSVGPIPDQLIGRGGQFTEVALDSFLSVAPQDVFWEVGFVRPTTREAVPVWEVTRSNYQFEMSVTAKVTSKGDATVGSSHQLAALDSTGTVRGTATGIAVGTDWIYFLTVFSNTNGERLQYAFYDDSLGQTLNIKETLTFSANEVLGTPETPVALTASRISAKLTGSKLQLAVDDATFIGTEQLEVVARLLNDPGQEGRDTIALSISNNYAPQLGGIPDQTVSFTESFSTIDLSSYTTLRDSDAVSYQSSGSSQLTVALTGSVATITKPEGWFGTETVLFTVVDQTTEGFQSSDTVVFVGKPEDRAPVVDSIPDQLTGSGGSFEALDLSTYLETNNPEAIQWSVGIVTTDSVVTNPGWSVNANDFQFNMSLTASVRSHSKLLTGNSHQLAAFSGKTNQLVGTTQALEVDGSWYYFLTIFNNSEEDSVYFKVYDADLGRVLPVGEFQTFTPNGIVGDPLAPFNIDAGYIIPKLTGDQVTFEILSIPFNGNEHFSFIATDTATANQLADRDTVVYSVIDQTPPVVTIPAPITINEGETFGEIDLSQYLSGLTNGEVTWSIQGADTLRPNLSGSRLTLTVPTVDYFGRVSLEARATSNENASLSDVETLVLEVQNVNDRPTIGTTPATEVFQGRLYSYELVATDIDNSSLTFSLEGKPDWLFFVPGTSKATLLGIPEGTDVGTYPMVLTVSDGELAVTQSFTVEVKAQFARIKTVSDVEILEGSSFEVLNLRELEDLANVEVYWRVAGGGALTVEILQDTLLNVTVPDSNYFGEEELFLQLINSSTQDVEDQKSLFYRVTNVNDAPVITSDPKVLAEVDSLYEYEVTGFDVEGDAFEIVFSDTLRWMSFIMRNDHPVVRGIPSEQDTGVFTINILITDRMDTTIQSYQLQVGSSFARLEVPQQKILEGDTFAIIPLNQYLTTSLDQDVYLEILPSDTLIITEVGGDSIQIIPENPDWFGTDTVTVNLRSTGDSSLVNTGLIVLEVENVNDAPEITSDPNVLVQIDSLYRYVIEGLDVDGDSLFFSLSDTASWLSLEQVGNQAILSGTPTVLDTGIYEVSILLTDRQDTVRQDYTLDISVSFAVLLVPDQKVNEGSSFPVLNLQDYLFTTPDQSVFLEVGTLDTMTVTTIGQDSIEVVPENQDWFGTETLQVLLRDQQDSTILDTAQIVFEVLSVNDAPEIVDSLLVEIAAGQFYEDRVTTQDIDSEEVTISATSTPDWLTAIAEVGGAMTFFGQVPGGVGSYEVGLAISDGDTTVTQTFTIQATARVLQVQEELQVRVFPNPVTEFLVIDSKESSLTTTLTDLEGKEVSISRQGNRLDLRHIASGVYILSIHNDKQKQYLRIVKR